MEKIYLRKKDNPRVLIADKYLLARTDLFRCDQEGNFLNSGSTELKAADAEYHEVMDSLYSKAKELKIKSYKQMKIKTLVERIFERMNQRINEG